MKTVRTISCSMEKMNEFIRNLVDQDAGRPAAAGLVYHKSLAGMNGRAQKT